MRGLLPGLILGLLSAQVALAGAWTLDRGHLQAFTGAITSHATRRFDDRSAPAGSIVFKKLFLQNWMEYGLTDAVTLFAAPQYVMADADMTGTGITHVNSRSLEAGVRILLLSRIGMLALQSSAKTAGAFDMSVSASGQAGRQAELRLLYGRNFKALEVDGFIDIQAAKRWIARPRPDEMAIEATLGLWLTQDDLVLLQSFNTFSGSGALPPYRSYRLSKLQVSLVQKVTSRWSLQSGYFFSPAGRNVVQERGFITTIWYQT